MIPKRCQKDELTMKMAKFRKLTLGLQTIYNESQVVLKGRTNNENGQVWKKDTQFRMICNES